MDSSSSATNLILGATNALTSTVHNIALLVTLTGSAGIFHLDYRTHDRILKAVGERAMLELVGLPTIEIVTVTAGNVAYNIRACHYARDENRAKPTSTGQIATIGGAVEIVRSQLLDINRASVGFPPNVVPLIKPDPLVGYSPRLDIGWQSIGTNSESEAQLVIHCQIKATGQDLPFYV
jgi:hypothetical protein